MSGAKAKWLDTTHGEDIHNFEEYGWGCWVRSSYFGETSVGVKNVEIEHLVCWQRIALLQVTLNHAIANSLREK